MDDVYAPLLEYKEELELQHQRRKTKKAIEGDYQRKRKAKWKAPAEDVEHMDDVVLKDAETTILHHYQYNRVDDIASHIDATIDQLNAIEETNRYSKWKMYEYQKKVMKLAHKLNE